MNITDQDGLWRLTDNCITELATGNSRSVVLPSAFVLGSMDYSVYLRKCRVAFNTGVWPKTHWKSGRITD